MFSPTKMTSLLALLVCSLLALHASTSLAADKQVASGFDVAVTFSEASAITGPATGRLVGALLDDGQPVAGRKVRLKSGTRFVNGSTTQEATTNAEGQFSFALPRGGAYLLEAAGNTKVCRVWPSHQAPPNAIRQVLLTTAERTVVRGQDFVSYSGGYQGGHGAGCGGVTTTGVDGGFQNCDSDCGSPPVLSNCDKGSARGGIFGGSCGCGDCGCDTCGCDPCSCNSCGGGPLGGLFGSGGFAGGRNKLLVGLLGGAIIGFALDEDDGPLEADVDAPTDPTAPGPTDPMGPGPTDPTGRCPRHSLR